MPEPHPQPSPRPPRHSALGTHHYLTRLCLFSLITSALIQLPLAWVWVLTFRPRAYSEDSAILPAPKGSTSGIAAIKIENNAYPGSRWILITGWSSVSASALHVNRSTPGEPFDSNPTHPWPIREALPAIADPAQWPEQGAPPAIPGVNYGITLTQLETIGWPFYCARGRIDTAPDQSSTTSRGLILTSSPLLDPFPRARQAALCYYPVPLGYALNTLFYAAAAIAVLLPLSILRRSLRTRKGRCPTCNYDLHATPEYLPCPECGTPRR
jgi:hypothetical protein